MKLPILILSAFCWVAWGQTDPASVYSSTQFIPYLDSPSEHYSRVDYSWYADNTGQPSLAYQNVQRIPSLDEAGGTYSLNMPGAWAIQPTASGVIVGVIGTGCNTNNVEMAGVVLRGRTINDRNQIYTDSFADYEFHDTGVCSIIAANKGNGVGISGLAPGVKLVVVSMPTAFVEFTTGQTAKAIYWCVTNGARILCLTYGESELNAIGVPALYDACQFANNHDVILVSAVAYGRNLDSNHTYPYGWSFPNYIGVGGVTREGVLWPPSSVGSNLVGAPARIIVMLGADGNVGYSSGNSFAAPQVAAICALLRAHRPDASSVQIVEWLKEGCSPVPGIFGRVNAHASLLAAHLEKPGPSDKFNRVVKRFKPEL